MSTDSRTLSKSDFKVGRSCPTKLFYREAGGYASTNDDDPYLALLAQGGYMIEQLAKAKYKDGIEIAERADPARAWTATADAIRQGDVTLFEASLLSGRQFARVDILQRKGGQLRLIEVKAKSWDSERDRELAAKGKPRDFWTSRGGLGIAAKWREYLEDVTYQTLLLESLFPEFDVVPVLCLVDKFAICTTDALPEKFEIIREPDATGRTRLVTARVLGDPSAIAREDLVIELDVGKEVDALREDVRQSTQRLLSTYEPQLSRIQAPLGVACKDCEYHVPKTSLDGSARDGFAECWGSLASIQPTILDLYHASSLQHAGQSVVESMIAQGQVGLTEIPQIVVDSLTAGGAVATRQWIQITHTKSGQTFVGPGLRTALESATYPLYFLDFEAARTAVPFHAGMRPYGLLAFQWSCHVLDYPGALLRHVEWINMDRSWPNEGFARSLAAAIGTSGTVLTWSSFEASTLRTVRDELAARGVLDDSLRMLFARVDAESSTPATGILDMHRLAGVEFFHPDMGGRTSIKKVLDALWRSDAQMRDEFFALTGKRGDAATGPYAALTPLVIAGVEQAVAEGTGAIRAYEALMFGAERHDTSVQQAWSALLLEYCKLDTLAMVLIWNHWRRAVGLE